MWSDSESEFDYINFRETAEIVSDLVSNQELRPVSVGVFGGWGSGKSTLVKLSRANLEGSTDFITVDFDAWLYQDFDDARSALLEAVSTKLLSVAEENDTAIDKAKSLLKRINKLRALGLLAEGGALLMGVPTFGALYKGVIATGDLMSGEADESDIADMKGAVEDVSGLVNTKQRKSPPQEIVAFRKEFSSLLQALDKTLIVYVDNLDRCLPRNAIITLEAIRLILFMPNTAFVIAADEDMVRLAVSDHYKTSQSRLINDYLDKLIQVPVHVPRLGVAEITSYTFLLFCIHSNLDEEVKHKITGFLQDSLKSLWKKPLISSDELLEELTKEYQLTNPQKQDIENSYILASRLAPMLATSRRISGNPRIVKRLLNTIWMRSSVAQKRGMPKTIDKALIAKIALFERCAGDNASSELYRQINEAESGKPKIIETLELAENIVKDGLPDSWDDIEFIKSWVSMEPKLAGVDLRAIAYLARETLPLRISAEGLSAASEKAVNALMKIGNLSSPALTSIMDSMPSDESVPVMEAVIEELRKVTSWSSKPLGFAGAVAIANRYPDAASKLVLFISSFDKLPPWMNMMIKDKEWYTDNR
ncbi:MAG TPA: P-loop NTPase fold protein [Anaerolineales bacterium]|nr:P-loop NTPase fold protein [Anaerolineales bacterium]